MLTKPPTTKPRTTAAPAPRTAAPVPTGIGLAYERFLELPVAVVLLVMWVAGVVLLGACALVVYAAVSAVVVIVMGAF